MNLAEDVALMFIVAVAGTIAGELILPGLRPRLRTGRLFMTALMARQTSRWTLLSAFAMWLGAVIMITWYVTGILSADEAIASGSLLLPLAWMAIGAVPVFATAWKGSASWRKSSSGFLLTSPLLALNMVVPAYHSIPYATATVSQKMVFDIVVGGGGFGEGLFLSGIWFVVVKYLRGWMGLASQPTTPTSSDDPDENPFGGSITIFSRLSQLLGVLVGRN